MTIYYIIFFYLIFLFFLDTSLKKIEGVLLYFLTFFLFSLFVGLRFEVGGDWFNYLSEFESTSKKKDIFSSFNEVSDFFHTIIMYFFSKIGLSFYYVNILYSSIFFVCLYFYLKRETKPWLALLIAYPYLITVVSIGYSRQSVALGLIFISFLSLINKKNLYFYFLIIIAASFHRSAIIFIILPFFMDTKFNYFKIFLISIILLVLYLLFKDNYDRMFYYYLGDGIHFSSKGAMPRLLFSVSAAIIFFITKNLIFENKIEKKIYLLHSIGILILTPFIYMYSTFVDRILVYFYGLQLIIFSRVSHVFLNIIYRNLINYLIIFIFFIYFHIWINLGNYSSNWYPYQTIFTTNESRKK